MMKKGGIEMSYGSNGSLIDIERLAVLVAEKLQAQQQQQKQSLDQKYSPENDLENEQENDVETKQKFYVSAKNGNASIKNSGNSKEFPFGGGYGQA
jgi:hypothetical protein